MKNLEKMQPQEKKKFLSMDLAERMIRVEQNVSSTFNKSVPYNQTEYYRSMGPSEQKEFEKFLKNKSIKKCVSVLALVIPLLIIILFSTGFTGNVVKESLGGTYNLFITLLFILVIVIAIYLIMKFSRKKKMEKKFNSHVRIINDILVKKRLKKKA